MSDFSFLAYLSDPFEVGASKFVLCDQAGSCSALSDTQISNYRGSLVTYDAAVVVDELRRTQKSPPSQLIEIGDALRMQSGRARDQGGEREWNVWRALRPYFSNDADRETILAISQTRQKQPSDEETIRLLKAMGIALKGLWEELLRDMQSNGEYERFVKIEVPVQQIFWHRQYKGIRLDNDHSERLIESVKNEKYTAFTEVASILGFSPSGLRFTNVGEFLSKTDARHLVEFSHKQQLQEYFRIAEKESKFAHAFLQYIRASQDLSILKRIHGGGERSYPVFNSFGTVTGRVLVSEPRLQELRKKYRTIISADQQNTLVYLDYSQYEPGILASLAGDANFIDRYNTSDLYASLSQALFGNEDQRGICKRVFLGFCYGMKRENIAKLLAGAEANEAKIAKYEKIVQDFFDAFPKLDEYKKSLEQRLLQDGFVSTVYGNRRVRTTSGNLSSKERRWAVSQMVQGTASLIFKEALIGLAEEFGKNCILLPMHDAVLMQFEGSHDDVLLAQGKAIQIMELAFKKWVGNVTPKVIAASFIG